MFKTVEFIGRKVHKTDNRLLVIDYKVIDTLFEEIMYLTIEKEWAEQITASAFLPSGLIHLYLEKGKMPDNLAIFYMKTVHSSFDNLLEVIELDREITDKYFPYFKYGENYVNCVINKVKKLKSIGRYKFENEKPRAILLED